MLEDLAGVRLTAKRVERAAEASGAAHAGQVRQRSALIAGRKLVPLPPRPALDMLYGVIDGTGVPMTSRETASRDGKGADGRARTREVKLAVFFTQHALDKDGYPVRDRASSSYIASFETASALAELVKAEAIRRGADHVRQHLHSLARSLEFMLGDRYGEWLAARLEDLDHGHIDGIEAAVRAYPSKESRKPRKTRNSGTSSTTLPGMRYHWFRQRGLFTGSGVVEAGSRPSSASA